jgi:hypothetical protein
MREGIEKGGYLHKEPLERGLFSVQVLELKNTDISQLVQGVVGSIVLDKKLHQRHLLATKLRHFSLPLIENLPRGYAMCNFLGAVQDPSRQVS